MVLSYEDIFTLFLGSIEDFNIPNMNVQDAYDYMNEYLLKAYSKPHVRQLFKKFVADKTIQKVEFEMTFEVNSDYDKDFVTDILVKGMVVEWLQPQVKSQMNTQQFFGGREQKYYAQSNHLAQLRSLLEDIIVEQRRLINDRGSFDNNYLGGN